MTSKRDLERRLERVEGFAAPTPTLEQYRTPANIAAHVVNLMTLHGDVEGRLVVDLGTGTGMLALGVALAQSAAVVGVDVDRSALETARENEDTIGPSVPVHWVQGDATAPPLCVEDATVVMNPPFGAQRGSRHADRAFLAAAASLARVSYSIHNEGSRDFVESFAADEGGTVTHAFQASFALPRQFDFHEDDERVIQAEVYRIEWE